jgi:hypothetical protein
MNTLVKMSVGHVLCSGADRNSRIKKRCFGTSGIVHIYLKDNTGVFTARSGSK